MINSNTRTTRILTAYDFNVVHNNMTRTATKIIANYFSSVQALASKPVFTMVGDKVVINLFYYLPESSKSLSSSTINSLGLVLSKVVSVPGMNRTVELRLVRLHYPYLNSYILAQYIAINCAKYKFSRIISSLWGANAIFSASTSDANMSLLTNPRLNDKLVPAYITGMKVRVSGRVMTERSVPRQTVQTAQIGSWLGAKGLEIEYSSFTSKNKKGAFTVKVWIAQMAISA